MVLTKNILKIEGDFAEGGGQVLRLALSLSQLTGKPFEIVNIRKGRPEPGLKNQHLFSIKAFKELYDCKVEDAYLGSEKIRFFPGKLRATKIDIDIGTAGSITLFLQSLLPAIVHEKKTIWLKVTGGTDVRWSMSYDYLDEVIIPNIRRYAEVNLELERRGYYPKGGGKVGVRVRFKKEKIILPINLERRGKIVHIKGISHASKDLSSANVAERQASSAKHLLSDLGCPVRIEPRYYDSDCTGSGVTLWAIYSLDSDDININLPIRLGADSLGEKGKRAEEVGSAAARKLFSEIKRGNAVDEHLADNLIPFLGLYGGRMQISRITGHVLAGIYVAERFLGVKFQVDKSNCMVRVDRPYFSDEERILTIDEL